LFLTIKSWLSSLLSEGELKDQGKRKPIWKNPPPPQKKKKKKFPKEVKKYKRKEKNPQKAACYEEVAFPVNPTLQNLNLY
jgi:hypothetical protein